MIFKCKLYGNKCFFVYAYFMKYICETYITMSRLVSPDINGLKMSVVEPKIGGLSPAQNLVWVSFFTYFITSLDSLEELRIPRYPNFGIISADRKKKR